MDMVIIKGKKEIDTSSAMLFVDHLGDKHWLPFSQIEIAEQDEARVTVKCPRWLAEKEEIPYCSKI